MLPAKVQNHILPGGPPNDKSNYHPHPPAPTVKRHQPTSANHATHEARNGTLCDALQRQTTTDAAQ